MKYGVKSIWQNKKYIYLLRLIHTHKAVKKLILQAAGFYNSDPGKFKEFLK